MPRVIIRPGEASEETIPQTVGWTRKREIGNMRRARITVERSLAESVTLNRKQDTIELDGVDTLRLVDIEKGGPTWTLVCYSFEWDANNVEPTRGGDLRSGTDKQLVDALVGEVPSWSVGSTTAFTNQLQFVFSHAHRHEALRRIERNVPGEIQFRDSGTVDYVQELGSDKSGSVELSASAGTIEDSIRITERGREYDGTHFRILGAHEGEAQIYANLVPSGDGATYENRVNYTTSRWSSGDSRDWDRWVNKDITDQATIEEEAAALGSEISSELVEVETTTNLSLDVGDYVQVVKPDADLDRKMRVHRVKEVSSDGTTVQELALSTRSVVRQDTSRDLRSIREFNTGFQGSAVWGTPSGGYQAVTSSDNYRLTFFYPDVEFEHTAELYVESQPYRTFHSGAASGGGSTETTQDNADFNNVATAETEATGIITMNDSTYTTIDSFTPLVDVSQVWCYVYTHNADTGGDLEIRLENQTRGDYFPSSGGWRIFNLDGDHATNSLLVDSRNVNGDTLNVQGKTSVGVGNRNYEFSVLWFGIGKHTHDITLPDHTHPVNPGVSNFPGTTASGVDVLVNGTTEASNIGSGSFTTTVDISGTLTKGAFNTVELTSDSTGWLYATAGLEAYRQIGKSP